MGGLSNLKKNGEDVFHKDRHKVKAAGLLRPLGGQHTGGWWMQYEDDTEQMQLVNEMVDLYKPRYFGSGLKKEKHVYNKKYTPAGEEWEKMSNSLCELIWTVCPRVM